MLAAELGFLMLPCAPGSAPELERTTAARLVFAAEADPREHRARVRLALARGLLLRAAVPHSPADVAALARRLGQIRKDGADLSPV